MVKGNTYRQGGKMYFAVFKKGDNSPAVPSSVFEGYSKDWADLSFEFPKTISVACAFLLFSAKHYGQVAVLETDEQIITIGKAYCINFSIKECQFVLFKLFFGFVFAIYFDDWTDSPLMDNSFVGGR